jgi:hypothetical protein
LETELNILAAKLADQDLDDLDNLGWIRDDLLEEIVELDKTVEQIIERLFGSFCNLFAFRVKIDTFFLVLLFI